ncbi:hypothetical protein [Pseudobdellovibrio sp. HCB154]|uniref:hypothetical protein n=1 Tax=Pseudobdellovibrio sp. HCB154 TaxID=3386277 RepID=UPI003916D550
MKKLRTQTVSFGLTALVSFSGCISSEKDRSPARAENRSIGCGTMNYPADSAENGFVVLDVLQPTKLSRNSNKVIQPLMCPEDQAKVKDLNLKPYNPLFKFVEDQQTVAKKTKNRNRQKIKEEPWGGENLDVTNIQDAEKLAKILQRYIFEGWFDADKTQGKTQYESHFRSNSLRTWCNTPWLNVTEKGREAIHGLTKEFPIRSTHVYTVPRDVEMTEDAVTWGISFFNKPVCGEYANFFNEKNAMLPTITDMRPQFKSPDGGLAFKLLFNTMPDWQNQMRGQWTSSSSDLKAYNWWTHVSHARQDDGKTAHDESIRELSNVALVQIDISLKDSRLKGTNPLLKNWIMLTYYFDPNFKNEYLADMNIPEPLKYMRPVGLQYGLGAGESHIFEGSRNNHLLKRLPMGDSLPPELDRYSTRLNGPVDNINGSCLGCHAAAGLRFNVGPMMKTSKHPPMTFLSNQDYMAFLKDMKKHPGITGDFDFNMQLDKAMRNFVNRNRPKEQKLEEAPK